jgi:hypothetical protein
LAESPANEKDFTKIVDEDGPIHFHVTGLVTLKCIWHATDWPFPIIGHDGLQLLVTFQQPLFKINF